MILTNLFRDQLDAYGEVDKTLSYFKKALNNLGYFETKSNISFEDLNKLTRTEFKLIINADDPTLLQGIGKFEAPIIGFSLDLDKQDRPKYEGEIKLPIF